MSWIVQLLEHLLEVQQQPRLQLLLVASAGRQLWLGWRLREQGRCFPSSICFRVELNSAPGSCQQRIGREPLAFLADGHFSYFLYSLDLSRPAENQCLPSELARRAQNSFLVFLLLDLAALLLWLIKAQVLLDSRCSFCRCFYRMGSSMVWTKFLQDFQTIMGFALLFSACAPCLVAAWSNLWFLEF